MFEELKILREYIKKENWNNRKEEFNKALDTLLKIGRFYYNSEELSIEVLYWLIDYDMKLYPNAPIKYAPMLVNISDIDSLYIPTPAYVWKEVRQNNLDGSSNNYSEVSYLYKIENEKFIINDWFNIYNLFINHNFLKGNKAVFTSSYNEVDNWCDYVNTNEFLNSQEFSEITSIESKKEKYLEVKKQLLEQINNVQEMIPKETSLSLKLQKDNIINK